MEEEHFGPVLRQRRDALPRKDALGAECLRVAADLVTHLRAVSTSSSM